MSSNSYNWLMRWVLAIVGVVGLSWGCGADAKPAAKPTQFTAITKARAKPVQVAKPTPKPKPTPQPIAEPLPLPDPTKFGPDQVEAVCHELFDHVFNILHNSKQKIPIKPDQLEKLREQGMKYCVKKLTRKMAECVMASITMQEIQKCTR